MKILFYFSSSSFLTRAYSEWINWIYRLEQWRDEIDKIRLIVLDRID